MSKFPKRKSISNKLRFEIFKRDSFICQYCGCHPPKAILHVDHIVPVKGGGDNSIDNLITSCSICNSGKAANPLTNIPESLKNKAARIKQQELQIKGYNKIVIESRGRLDEECWEVANQLLGVMGLEEGDIDRAWFASIRKFIKLLGLGEVLEAVDATENKTFYSKYPIWKYFCGVCWNKIKETE